MHIQQIKLNFFRNINNLDCKFNSNFIVFLGSNGQGKTNLLEGIYLCLSGHSFRRVPLSEMLYKQQSQVYPQSLIELIVHSKDQLDYHLKCCFSFSKKEHFVNQKKQTSSNLIHQFQSVTFTSEDLLIIKWGPDRRRCFFDELLLSIDPTFLELDRNYNKCLKTRNRILKDHLNGLYPKSKTEALLRSIEAKFLNLAQAIILKRIKGIQILKRSFSQFMTQIQGRNVDISVDYLISEQNVLDFDENQILLLLSEKLKQREFAEFASGQTLVGPHRDDFRFNFENNNAKHYCSQGQQRALILALKLAQIECIKNLKGHYPILFLDDVFSELDTEKQSFLLAALSKLKTQTFISTTDEQLPLMMLNSDVSLFFVHQGQLFNKGSNEKCLLVK